jgi:redox-sensitive bicupin YhaK (pirin superfamily)
MPTTRRIDRIHDIVHLGGDSQVDRKALVLPPGHFDLFDPFLMLAEDWFSTPGFDWHPHRGIETVTIVVDGALEHGDSRGNAGVLGPGDVQWMTAGAGIIHRELAHRDERVHSLQLWVNLPSSSKMVESRYQDFTLIDMAVESAPGVKVHLVSGALGDGRRGPAENHHPIHGLQLRLEPGASTDVRLPAEDRAFLYVRTGGLAGIGPAGTVGWSDPVEGDGSTLTVQASADTDEVTEVVLFSGRPIGERVVAHGPFVMNSEDQIVQAFGDYRSGRFGPVPRLARVP